MKQTEKILVIGACGQIGRELTAALRKQIPRHCVIAADIQPEDKIGLEVYPYRQLNVLHKEKLEALIAEEKITQIYHLAAMLSANGELNPQAAWQLNMDSLLTVLDLSVKYRVKKVFWPSSIAVFGPDSQKQNCPQQGITEPVTIYGISKAAGEYWCKYYFEKFGLDVRSLRYPGLISYSALPGGGTTDYAVDIFHHAVKGQLFTCFLEDHTALPMMYMHDAIRATLELMDAPGEQLLVRTSYNLGALSFTPKEIYEEIEKEVPGFRIHYAPDFRQQIAESWPQSVDDSQAKKDWGWEPAYDLKSMVSEMLRNLSVLS
jgi:nucleoside-diphosphate-sugar epimerase